LLDRLWRVIYEEFWKLDPEKIDDCFWAVNTAAEDTIEREGKTKGKQKSGARRAKKAWLKARGFARIPFQEEEHWYPDGARGPRATPRRRRRPRAERAAPPNGGAARKSGSAAEPGLRGQRGRGQWHRRGRGCYS